MIKRTIHFGNTCHLKKKDMQLVVEYPDELNNKTVPIEDIGMIILEDQRITISNALLMTLMDNNAAVITCNWQHLPEGLLLPMFQHHAFTEKVRIQMEASVPLQKNLWQQTVVAKIKNQANLLAANSIETENMVFWASKVKSGDPENYEARAAAYYWQKLFENPAFIRGRFDAPPNNLLNYGYAILRAIVARSLLASGMMTFKGIHHRNKYNPYCLADDIMEPYRPYVDRVVLEMVRNGENISELTPDLKRTLLSIPVTDIIIDDNKSPLMVGMQRTTASLMQCFEGKTRKILYPVLT
jgi:CRISP-associated protein Cas1